MTATNEERRKSARMIRQSGDEHPSTWQNMRDIAGMPKDFTLPEIRNRLADLIDIETCRIDYDHVHLDYVCSECGEVFETGTYNSVNDDDEAFLKDFKYCPNCGRKVVKE